MADREIVDQPPPRPQPGVASVQALVRADLEDRERLGVERYGTPLQPYNGRNPLVDAYQEALDQACYLRQAIAEGSLDQLTALQQRVVDLEHDLQRQTGLAAELRRQLVFSHRTIDESAARIVALVSERDRHRDRLAEVYDEVGAVVEPFLTAEEVELAEGVAGGVQLALQSVLTERDEANSEVRRLAADLMGAPREISTPDVRQAIADALLAEVDRLDREDATLEREDVPGRLAGAVYVVLDRASGGRQVCPCNGLDIDRESVTDDTPDGLCECGDQPDEHDQAGCHAEVTAQEGAG